MKPNLQVLAFQVQKLNVVGTFHMERLLGTDPHWPNPQRLECPCVSLLKKLVLPGIIIFHHIETPYSSYIYFCITNSPKA